MVQCPKCKTGSLQAGTLGEDLESQYCLECQGTWIPAAEYEAWQDRHPQPLISPEILSQPIVVKDFPSSFDRKAALCPECNRYLARAKVTVTPSFFIERCPQCRGIWCDRGEWEVLVQLGLHKTIEQLFSSEWQTQVREQQQFQKERQALIEKLGKEVATQIFELANLLKKHPHGDFALAYLMRQVTEAPPSKIKKKLTNN